MCIRDRRLVGARRVQPFGGREERGQQRFGCQYRPEPVERGDELLVLGELVEQVRPQFLPGCPIIPGQPAPADAGDRPFGEHPRDDVSEHRARVVVRQPAGDVYKRQGSDAVIVDPGQRVMGQLRRILDENRLTPAAVLLTHGHIDHMWSAQKVSDTYGCPTYICLLYTSRCV